MLGKAALEKWNIMEMGDLNETDVIVRLSMTRRLVGRLPEIVKIENNERGGLVIVFSENQRFNFYENFGIETEEEWWSRIIGELDNWLKVEEMVKRSGERNRYAKNGKEAKC